VRKKRSGLYPEPVYTTWYATDLTLLQKHHEIIRNGFPQGGCYVTKNPTMHRFCYIWKTVEIADEIDTDH